MIRVGFSGSRHGMTWQQQARVRTLLAVLNPIDQITSRPHFSHGDCVGADAEAHDLAKELGYFINIHPPINRKNRAFCKGNYTYPEQEYKVRNRDIVDNVDRLIACPRDVVYEVKSPGTWHTIRYAYRCRKYTLVIAPDGELITAPYWNDAWEQFLKQLPALKQESNRNDRDP